MFGEGFAFLDLDMPGKKEAIGFLAERLADAGMVADLEAFLADVDAREALCPTNIGRSTAIPHGVSGATGSASAAFMRLLKPIDWGEGEEVRFVFLISAPRSVKGDGYVEAIGRLSRFLLEESSLELLSQLSTAQEALQLLWGI